MFIKGILTYSSLIALEFEHTVISAVEESVIFSELGIDGGLISFSVIIIFVWFWFIFEDHVGIRFLEVIGINV